MSITRVPLHRRALSSLAALLPLVFSNAAIAAAGWTDFGTISSVEQDPANYGSVTNEVFVVVNVSSNPSGCSNGIGFFMSLDGPTQADVDRKKRLFSMLLLARSTSSPVRLFLTGVCHTVGYAELDGLVL